jgi:lactoylglutathione lyase
VRVSVGVVSSLLVLEFLESPAMGRPRLLGINHIALEVDDLEAALEFYGRLFEFELRGRVPGMAFLDMGDQFIALAEGRSQAPDDGRHFGLVVDDIDATRAALAAAGVEPLPGRGLDFRDPSGNRVQVVDYREIQFSKTAEVLDGMDVEIAKNESALAELREKGLAGGG